MYTESRKEYRIQRFVVYWIMAWTEAVLKPDEVSVLALLQR
jgi:hypothetical protein